MTTLAVDPRPDQARAGVGTQLYTAVMLAALVAGAWWAFQFRVEALLSGLDPNCPVTGCYADFGPTCAPIARSPPWLRRSGRPPGCSTRAPCGR